MNIQDIKKLFEMFDNSSSIKLKITNDNFEILLEKSGAKFTKNQPEVLQLKNAIPQDSKNVITNNVESNLVSTIDNTNNNNSKTSISLDKITSPMVGTFYRSPSPDSAPYVNIGDKVKKGQTIAIIEAMKIMNEIEAEFDCKIVDIFLSDAQSVEFSTELFLVEKI